jgi:hypothetical protein
MLEEEELATGSPLVKLPPARTRPAQQTAPTAVEAASSVASATLSQTATKGLLVLDSRDIFSTVQRHGVFNSVFIVLLS